MELFIGNLPGWAQREDLERLFDSYGQYRQFRLSRRRLSGGGLSHFAIARIMPDSEARRAMREWNLRPFGDRALLVLEYCGVAPLPPPPLRVVVNHPSHHEPRQRQRRQQQRRQQARRQQAQRQQERRIEPQPAAGSAVETRFNEHRQFQRRYRERRAEVDRRSEMERRQQERRQQPRRQPPPPNA